jgi:hypothetical protein
MVIAARSRMQIHSRPLSRIFLSDVTFPPAFF